MWDGLITSHARQRYMERVTSRRTYGHLRGCVVSSCVECRELIFQLRRASVVAAKYMDPEIRRRISSGFPVADAGFLREVCERYPGRRFDFVAEGGAVFVVLHRDFPILVTVMTSEMITWGELRNC